MVLLAKNVTTTVSFGMHVGSFISKTFEREQQCQILCQLIEIVNDGMKKRYRIWPIESQQCSGKKHVFESFVTNNSKPTNCIQKQKRLKIGKKRIIQITEGGAMYAKGFCNLYIKNNQIMSKKILLGHCHQYQNEVKSIHNMFFQQFPKREIFEKHKRVKIISRFA